MFLISWHNDKYNKNGTFTDIKDPSITTSNVFPLINGLTTEIICSATVRDVYTELTWNCLDLTPLPTTVLHCNKYMSKIEYKAALTDNGKLCNCSARINAFVSTAELPLEIQSKRVLFSIVTVLHYIMNRQ